MQSIASKFPIYFVNLPSKLEPKSSIKGACTDGQTICYTSVVSHDLRHTPQVRSAYRKKGWGFGDPQMIDQCNKARRPPSDLLPTFYLIAWSPSEDVNLRIVTP